MAHRTRKTKNIGPSTKEVDSTKSDPGTAYLDVTIRFDNTVLERLHQMRKAKGEFNVQPLVRFAVVNMLENAGF